MKDVYEEDPWNRPVAGDRGDFLNNVIGNPGQEAFWAYQRHLEKVREAQQDALGQPSFGVGGVNVGGGSGGGGSLAGGLGPTGAPAMAPTVSGTPGFAASSYLPGGAIPGVSTAGTSLPGTVMGDMSMLGGGASPWLKLFKLGIPALTSVFGAIFGKKKQPDVTKFPEFQQMMALADLSRNRITNSAPLYNSLLQMSMRRLPGEMQGPNSAYPLDTFAGIDAAPKAVPRPSRTGTPAPASNAQASAREQALRRYGYQPMDPYDK